MDNGQWAMGNGQWDTGTMETEEQPEGTMYGGTMKLREIGAVGQKSNGTIGQWTSAEWTRGQ